MDDFNDILSSEEILGEKTHNPAQESGKKSNARELEDLHKKAVERSDDGFEDYLQQLKEKIEAVQNKLSGGESGIRKPKMPVKVFLRFHMEEYNRVKSNKPEWTPHQITLSLKKRWQGMSEAQKERYNRSYEKDIEKYDKLLMLFNRLLQKPKKPVTPYFQFFTEYLPVYKKNYPELSQLEVARMIGRDWRNFDVKKKAELNQEFERQKVIFGKQLKVYQANANDYTKFNDYISKVEDYEKELEEELESLRSRYPKAPQVAEIKRKEREEQLQEEKRIKMEKLEQERQQAIANKINQKKSSLPPKTQQTLNSFFGLPTIDISSLSKPNVKSTIEQVSTQKPAKPHKISQIDIESDLKEARNSNLQNPRLNQPAKKYNFDEKEEEEVRETEIRKIFKKEDGTGTSQGVEVQPRSQIRNPQENQQKTVNKENPYQQIPSSRTRSQRIKEAEEIQKYKNTSTRQANHDDKKTPATISQKKRRLSSEKIDETEEKHPSRAIKKFNSSSSTMIKYMLGMRNGDETEYLVLFEDGKQRWTREDDNIFKNDSNSVKLDIFLRQLQEKKK